MGQTLWWNCHLLCCTPLCYCSVLKCFQIQLDLSSFRAAYEDRRASLVVQMVKKLPAMQETWILSLGQEDPQEKGMVTHSSILTWRIPWTEESGGPQSMGSQRVRHNWATNTHTHTHIYTHIRIGGQMSQGCGQWLILLFSSIFSSF